MERAHVPFGAGYHGDQQQPGLAEEADGLVIRC